MTNKQINYGFIAPIVKLEDYFLGSKKLGSQIINPSGDWRPYLPTMEYQNIDFETYACVTFGIHNAVEILHKFLLKTEPNYADRFLAKMSETDHGNMPNKVADTLRNVGTVSEEKWPMVKTYEEYYQEIPEDIKQFGKEWLKSYSFGYEWTSKDQLKDALQRSPVGMAVAAWQQNEKGEYTKFMNWNHWCIGVFIDEQDRIIVFDTYDKSLKTLEKNYDVGFPQIYTLQKKTRKGRQKHLADNIKLD